jgi:hypothetical protein
MACHARVGGITIDPAILVRRQVQYLPSMTTVPEVLGTSIRLYLADGRADGFRLVEKSNWTGLGLEAAAVLRGSPG